MIGLYTAIEASKLELSDADFQERLPYVIREVKEMGGHGFHGANESGDIELSATYMMAKREGYIEPIKKKGFFHGLGQSIQLCPKIQLTNEGREKYDEYKALEATGDLEPNRYAYFFSC